ncbi:MAG: hypothetical protein ACE5FY_05855 [Nitrospiria bacterium]
MRHKNFLMVLIFLNLFFVNAKSGQAIPSFARKYNYVCTVCHTMPPKLNKFGLAFMADGYQLNVHTELQDKLQQTKNLSLLRTIPLSLRIIADAHYTFEKDQPRTDLHLPEEVVLYSAGSLTEKISYWITGEPFENEGLDEAFVKFLVNYNNPYVTIKLIKAGLMDMRDYYNFASGRNFTIENYAIHAATLQGVNPFSLGKAQRTIELRGMFTNMTMWTIALTNGPESILGEFDQNNEKDIYFRVHRLFLGQYAIGGLGYWGTNTLSTGEKSRFQRYLIDIDIDRERLDLTGTALFAQDESLASVFSVSSVNHFGYFIEVNFHLAPKEHLLFRYDFVDSKDVERRDFPELFAETVTLQMNYFHRLNLRFISEAVIDLSGRNDHILRLGIDFDF